MTPETKAKHLEWIREASYEDLLRKNRFASIGSEFFQDDEIYVALVTKMKILERDDPNLRSRTSKVVGW